jgi:hypothetical protein
MFQRLILLAIIGIPLVGETAHAAQTDPDEAFISTLIAANTIEQNCPGYEGDVKGVADAADRTGVDRVKVVAAMIAAIGANIGAKYNRDDLMPSITRVTVSTYADMAKVKKLPDFCKTYVDIIIPTGFIKRKAR